MLGKLLKNEIKHSARYVMTIYGCAAAMILFMFFGMLTKITWIGVVGSIILYVVAFIEIIMTLVSVIKNFYDTLYGNQGYLSFTLPVKCSTLLISKIIVSFIWIIFSFVLGGLCFLVIALNAKSAADGTLSGFFDVIRMSGVLEYLPSGAMIAKLVIIFVLMALMTILTFVGFVYFAVTLANTRPLQGHPKLFGFLIFFVSYGVTNSIGAKLTYSLPLAVSVTTDSVKIVFKAMDGMDSLFSFGIGGTIFMALVALGMLFATGYIMEHKVNIK